MVVMDPVVYRLLVRMQHVDRLDFVNCSTLFEEHIYFTNVRDLSLQLGMTEFLDKQNNEFLFWYTGYNRGIVWSGLKRLGTHEFVIQPMLSAVFWVPK